MIEDITREVPQERPDAAKATKMDRRSFLLALSGGALALTATGLLAGCGGGGSNGGGFSGGSNGGSPQQFNGTVPFGNGQSGAIALTVVPSGQASGTVTVTGTAVQNYAVTPHITVLSIPNGVYAISGTVDSATGVYALSGNIPTVGPVTVNGTLPSQSGTGSFALVTGGQTFTGTLAAGSITSTSSSSTSSSSTSSSSSSGTGGTVGVTSSTVTNSGGGYTTTLTTSSGVVVATLVATAGFPSTTVSALAASALPSAATVPSGKTLVSPYIVKVVANSANVGNATLTLSYTGTHTTDIAYVSDGAAPFVQGAYGIRTSGGTEDINVSAGGGLDIAYNSITSNYGNTGYVGLFA